MQLHSTSFMQHRAIGGGTYGAMWFFVNNNGRVCI